MTFFYQIVFQIRGMITGPWNKGHNDLIIFWGHSWCNLELSKVWHFSIKQSLRWHNHWSMKYRSNWPTYTLRSLLVSHETNIQGMTFLYQIVFEIWGIITGPWNTSHNDLIIFCGHSVSHGTNIQGMTYLHLRVMRHYHWTMEYIGHIDLIIFWGHLSSHMELISKIRQICIW